LQSIAHPLIEDRRVLRASVQQRWRVLLAAALLSLSLGVALREGLTAGGSSAPDGARSQSSQRSLLSLPLALQGPASQALGADSPAYRIGGASGGGASGGMLGANPGQHLKFGFARSGVSVSSGTAEVGLSLRALGYGASLKALTAATPISRGNRVLYTRPGVSEWYANGPLGLEQGFAIARAPSMSQAAPLTLSIALSGNARASLAAGGRSIVLSHAGRPVLRYGGLRATDARGRVLHSWLALQGGRVLLRVNSRGAAYPLRIDPLVQQGEKLTSGETLHGLYGELFGASVALSADGNTALIGAPQTLETPGAAWVFTRSGSSWALQGPKLVGSGQSGDGQFFGASVALSADGNTALIGGSQDNFSNGAAWVFTRSGSTWTQQGAKLTGTGVSGVAFFGASVALSADGNTALIGGYLNGAAWVFTRSGSSWTQQGAELTAGEGEFGRSVALSADGNTALIGAPRESAAAGSAWVFTRSGSTWTQQGAKLTGTGQSGSGEDGGTFGASVSLSSDGNTALIGGPLDNGSIGGAWVFTRSGSTWTQQGAKLTGADEIGMGRFGESVALSSDGNTALIGGPTDEPAMPNPEVVNNGAAWIFTRSGETWTQQGAKLTGTGEYSVSDFGTQVALSADASTALIGDPLDDESVGAVWTFGPGESSTGGGSPGDGSTGSTSGPATGSGSTGGSGSGAPGKTVVPLTTPAKPLTRAQKLAKALKACKKQKSKSKRKACDAKAKKRYKPKPKKAIRPKQLAPAAASASASSGACGVFSQAAFTKIVGLAHIVLESTPEICQVLAWSGRKPNPKQIHASFQNGTLASLEIHTYTEMPPGPLATWEEEIAQRGKGLRIEFQRFHLKPKPFTPPSFGADGFAGYAGSEGPIRYVRAIWSRTSTRTMVTVTLIHANKKPAPVQAELLKAATSIVPAALGI
jgi:hypothetical protein